jgi:hypothetical protein
MKYLSGMRFPDWVLVFTITFVATTVLAPVVRGGAMWCP